VFEPAKTVHALDRAATVIGIVCNTEGIFNTRLEKFGFRR
jgi:hypothetical protein